MTYFLGIFAISFKMLPWVIDTCIMKTVTVLIYNLVSFLVSLNLSGGFFYAYLQGEN